MSRRRRPSQQQDSGGGASWMDTYGDLVTLLLCFFVLLFSMSTIDSKKWEDLVGAFSGAQGISLNIMTPEMAVGVPIDEISTGLENGKDDFEEQEVYVDPLFYELLQKMQQFLVNEDLADVAELTPEASSLKISMRFKDSVLFDSAKYSIKSESHNIMDGITSFIKENQQLIREVVIEGHTDNDPVAPGSFLESNLLLSARRGESAQKYIVDSDSSLESIIAVKALGETEPIAPNDTAEGKAMNRRIEFVVESISATKN